MFVQGHPARFVRLYRPRLGRQVQRVDTVSFSHILLAQLRYLDGSCARVGRSHGTHRLAASMGLVVSAIASEAFRMGRYS